MAKRSMTIQQQTDATLGIDRRQRLAASMLLMAFDLPAPMHPVSAQITAAAKITPGCTLDEFPALQSRRTMLEAAHRLTGELLAEAAEETGQ